MNNQIEIKSDVIQQKIKECLEDVQNQIEVPQQLYQDIQPLIINKSQINKQSQSNQQIQSFNNKSFIYELIHQYSQNQFCGAITFNKDCSTLLTGCKNQIQVFEFNQGMIKQTQILNEHRNNVFTLNFMNKSNQFISGSVDNSIIIWQLNQNNQWIPQQTLNGHTSNILCLILNNNEDLIISGSYDIKFWIKKNEWTCQQTIKDHSSSVYGLSVNQQQNKVVSCGHDKLILIMEQQGQNKEWIVIQKITVEQSAYRICFIDNNMFTLSQYNKEQISVYEMNNINQQFTKTKDIDVKCGSDNGYCLFPQQYINQKCILMSKNGLYVNLIRKKLNAEFVTQQSIHFDTNQLFGGMSNDGDYLITWDNESKQIQVRRYKEL
ncbi:unnamed protein product [Paramecium primaurelia]|uniref:WD40-repeat-containing domain n=1 Tax=Paramecium primaurelia TaxID=5886 RepID=A0A8S1LC38_PARPR|nr:unnamed protein product [Paramecium primaurelia]